MPFFSCSNSVPESLREGNGSLIEYSETSMYWIVSRIAQFAYLRYDKIGAEVRQIIDEYENRMVAEADAAISKAAGMNAAAATDYLSGFSYDNASGLFAKWKDLDKYLLVKYIDGNIKRQNADGSFVTNGYNDHIPEYPIWEDYSDKWKENVVRDNGDVLRIRK